MQTPVHNQERFHQHSVLIELLSLALILHYGLDGTLNCWLIYDQSAETCTHLPLWPLVKACRCFYYEPADSLDSPFWLVDAQLRSLTVLSFYGSVFKEKVYVWCSVQIWLCKETGQKAESSSPCAV
jgi:hypothetical protein